MLVIPTTPTLDTARNSTLRFKQVGTQICDRMESVVVTSVALVKLAQFSVNHGGRLVTAATTLLVGLERVYNGDLFTGGTLAAVGAREAYNVLSTKQADVQRLLQDASAGVDMIKTLEQANQSSFDSVEVNLTAVQTHMLDLEERCKKIEHLATQGSAELDEQKTKTVALYKEAGELFKQTLDTLNNSKGKMKSSGGKFSGAIDNIGLLVELAQQEKGDFKERAAQFAELSKKIYQECLEAKGILEEGHQALSEGLTLLNQALAKFHDATFEAGKTVEMAQSVMEKVKAQAQIEQKSESHVADIKKELQTMQGRNKAILAIADEVQEDIEEAQQLMETKFGYESIILGGGTGAFLGAVFSGGLAAGTGAIGGTVAYHNRESIGNVLFGKDAEPVPSRPSLSNPVTFEFNQKSSGFWGRYISKRPSYTNGKLSIDVGGETVSFKFNLNDKHKVSRKDLWTLYQKLSKKLDQDPSFGPACLKILNSLSTVKIERGGRHKTALGFISVNDPYFSDLIMRAKK